MTSSDAELKLLKLAQLAEDCDLRAEIVIEFQREFVTEYFSSYSASEAQRQQRRESVANRENNDDSHSILSSLNNLAERLKISRDSGDGLYHIDLLLERARLHLPRGDAGAALDDIEVALDTGIPANEETGQVELLAANHEECGYAWAIPAGLQLRAEALLLQAAQTLGTNRVAGVERSKPPADATSNETGGSLRLTPATLSELPTDVATLIDQAKQLLHEALDRWHDLRDPDPTEDNNFKLDGKEYNYRAAETWQILQDVDRGTLTKYPLQNTREIESKPIPVQTQEPSTMSKRFHVALSFPGEHRAFVLQVADALAAKLKKDRVFYDEWYETELLGSGGDLKLQSMYEQAELVVPFFSEYYDKPWCSMEWETIRGILLTRRKDDAVIPVHLDDTDVPGWSVVNFGIRLKGRSPQQIADVILQALAERIARVAKNEAAAAPSAVDRLKADLTALAGHKSAGWLASLIHDCCLNTPPEIDEGYDFDELKTCINEAAQLVLQGASQAGDRWAKNNSLQAVALVVFGLTHATCRSPKSLLLIADVCEAMLSDDKIKLDITWPSGAKDELYSLAIETNDPHDDSIYEFLDRMCKR